jgi:hypothetical protein
MAGFEVTIEEFCLDSRHLDLVALRDLEFLRGAAGEDCELVR